MNETGKGMNNATLEQTTTDYANPSSIVYQPAITRKIPFNDGNNRAITENRAGSNCVKRCERAEGD